MPRAVAVVAVVVVVALAQVDGGLRRAALAQQQRDVLALFTKSAREVLDAVKVMDDTPGTLYLDGPTHEHEEAAGAILDAAPDLARAVIDLTARLDAERFAHANTAVKVKRVEELADDMDHDADLLDQTDDLRLHLIAATHREDATRLRTALNGDDQ